MKKPKSIEQVRAIVRKMAVKQHQSLSKKTGVPYSTIRKFAYGITTSPRHSTYIAIANEVCK